MDKHTSNEKFKQELIDESLKYQLLFKKTDTEYKNLQSIYNINIGNLKALVAAKEEEIKMLKQKNVKTNMEIGSYTSRNHALTNEKKQIEKEFHDLYLKYDETLTQNTELELKYNEQKTTYEQAYEKHLKEIQYLITIINFNTNENTNLKEELEREKAKNIKQLNDFIQVIRIHNNDNDSLKQQLAQEKESFIELQKLLQDSYEVIFKMSAQDN